MTTTTSPPLLEAHAISKAYPGVQALANVSLRIRPGEVLAVVGENGAGKSTLMKVLAGIERPDAGTLLWEGQPTRLGSVHAAEKLGIVLIHQELNLAENLDVASSVYLGREPTWLGPLRLVRWSMYRETATLTARLGLDVSPRRSVGTLPLGQQQLVEIARALSLKSRLLILDEPTSSLSARETERLFVAIRDLKAQGVAIIYISHRLKEVETLADRVTVLRDGKNSGELGPGEIRAEAMVRLMVGRELTQLHHRTRLAPSPHSGPLPPGGGGLGRGGEPAESKNEERRTENREPRSEGQSPRSPILGSRFSVLGSSLLRVQNLRWHPRQSNGITFDLKPGEIVGLAGLVGAGRSEMAEALVGLRKSYGGTVEIGGQPLRLGSVRRAFAAGLFLLPEDRRTQGLLLASSVRWNSSLASLDRLRHGGLLAFGQERNLAEEMRQKLGIRTPSIEKIVGLLSGGNQQKVVFAKGLARQPRVLILDEPTRGVDVGAKAEIYALMDQLAQQGVAILVISSDLEEVLGMSDRVLVLHEGQLAGELSREQMTEEAIMLLATGATSG